MRERAAEGRREGLYMGAEGARGVVKQEMARSRRRTDADVFYVCMIWKTATCIVCRVAPSSLGTWASQAPSRPAPPPARAGPPSGSVSSGGHVGCVDDGGVVLQEGDVLEQEVDLLRSLDCLHAGHTK